MKRTLLLTVSVLCLAGMAFAQSDVGSIDIFSDGTYTDCNVIDAGGIVPVYIVHTHAGDGARASQWMLEVGAGITMVSVGSSSPYATAIGDPFTGISIAYGDCQTDTNNLILTVNFFATGTSGTCELLSIVPDPASIQGMVEIVDCLEPPNGPNRITLEKGGQARVNPDGTCQCTTPVRETTWGGVKALYGN